jgi:hypothetical protein
VRERGRFTRPRGTLEPWSRAEFLEYRHALCEARIGVVPSAAGEPFSVLEQADRDPESGIDSAEPGDRRGEQIFGRAVGGCRREPRSQARHLRVKERPVLDRFETVDRGNEFGGAVDIAGVQSCFDCLDEAFCAVVDLRLAA